MSIIRSDTLSSHAPYAGSHTPYPPESFWFLGNIVAVIQEG